MIKNFKYELQISGHEPPYKWTVYRSGGGLVTRVSAASGEADTLDEAIRVGGVAARFSEKKRRHENTVRTVDLFEVDQDFNLIEPDAIDLENWPVAEPVRPRLSETEPVGDDQFADPFPYEPPAMEFED